MFAEANAALGRRADTAEIVRVQEIPAAATIDEAAHLLRTSRNTVYQLLEAGALRSFSLGRKRLVSGNSIAQLMRDCEQETYAPMCDVGGNKRDAVCAAA